MNNLIELTNLEIYEFCMLNRVTGGKKFYKEKKIRGFTGLYFKDKNNFLAIYPTDKGPKIFYDGKEYEINKELTISLQKIGQRRTFEIKEYGIKINYTESPYIGFDAWSDEIDVDLLYMIEQSYKDDSFYSKFTIDK